MPRKKFIITTPYPTLEEVRVTMGISKKRAREIEKLVESLSNKQASTKSNEAKGRRAGARSGDARASDR